MTRPAYYNEIDPWCCERLRERIAAGDLPAGHVDERDVRLVSPTDLQGYGQLHFFAGIGGGAVACRLAGLPDDFPIITGGVPCQPASQAGKRLGENDARWLWPQFLALVGDRVLRQHYVLAENPAGILTLADGAAWAGIMAALAEGGRDAEWIPVSAADVGSTHERERIWLVAYPNVDAWEGRAGSRVAGEMRRSTAAQQQDVRPEGESCADHTRSSREALADADGAGFGEQRRAVAVGSELAAAEYGSEGRGAGDVADADGGPRTRGSWGSAVGARAEVAGARDGSDAIDVADADGDGLVALAAGDSAHGGVDVEYRDDAHGCGNHQQRGVGREANPTRGGDRAPESTLGGAAARVSAVVGGTAYAVETEALTDGTSGRGCRDEVVRALRGDVRATEVRWSPRGHRRLSPSSVLHEAVRLDGEEQGPPRALGDVSLSRKEAQEVIVRGVWLDEATACASCRRAAGEQRSDEPADAVRLLSQLLTCDCGAAWLDDTRPPSGVEAAGLPAYMGGTAWPAPPGQPQHPWEEPRLVPDIGPDGRKALAAYGNAWLPQAAIPALHVILAHAGGAR